MNRAVRNRLADLLLGAFGDPAKRGAILRMALYWDLCAGERQPGISVADLEAAWATRYRDLTADPWDSAEAVTELKGILEARGIAGAPQRGVRASNRRTPSRRGTSRTRTCFRSWPPVSVSASTPRLSAKL
jgi:hypothetical protein